MELADLVALARLPIHRRRLVEAVRLADAIDGRLATALDSLGNPEPCDTLRQHAREALDLSVRSGMRTIRWDGSDYPEALRTLPDFPVILWAKGLPIDTSRPAVAIVGARAASASSREIAREMGEGLARAGVTVVSGLARGCDGAAHEGALAAGGPTIAVLGCGVDITYPPEHEALARGVAATGTLLSEFAPGTLPLPHHFPLRNRIIAGLSRAVVVVEAHERSGSLITAGCALEQGRDVMVVPGPVRSGRNRGAHALLKDGATLVESAADVLTELGLPGPTHCGTARRAAAPQHGSTAALILSALDPDDAVDLDQLQASTGLDFGALTRHLTELELAGLAVRQPGGRFVCSLGKVIT